MKYTAACLMGRYCAFHGYVHGGEAAELRSAMERLALELSDKVAHRLHAELDSIDARDSCEWSRTDQSQFINQQAPSGPACVAPVTPWLCIAKPKRSEVEDKLIAELEKKKQKAPAKLTIHTARATVVSPCCRAEWNWHVISGIRLYTTVKGRRVYSAECGKCGEKWELDGGRVPKDER